MIFTVSSATEYSDEEYLHLIETIESCNDTYRGESPRATLFCIYRKDGKVLKGFLESLPDISNNTMSIPEDSEDR